MLLINSIMFRFKSKLLLKTRTMTGFHYYYLILRILAVTVNVNVTKYIDGREGLKKRSKGKQQWVSENTLSDITGSILVKYRSVKYKKTSSLLSIDTS